MRLQVGRVDHDGRTTRYTYNNQSQVTKAAVDGFATLDVRYTYNVLGRLTDEDSDVASLEVDYGYDANGWLTFIGYGDGYYVNYDYYNTGEMKAVRELGATSGSSVLAQIGIDSLGRRTSLLRGDGSREDRAYDANGKGPWLDSLSQTMTGGGSFTRSFYYTPANTIFGLYTNNDAYVWTQAINVERTYATNALNQYTRSGSINLGYDGRGNLTSAPRSRTGLNAEPGDSSSYSYNPQNMLVGANGYTLDYDATGRLVLDSSAADRKYGYAGTRLLTERKISDGSMMNRYVYGPDEAPLMVHDGGSTSGTRHYLVADERGSVVALTNGQGALQNINTYDEFGIPGSNNTGRFGYTGQAWNTTLGMWYYKARIYSPNLGRFMQTDPIGYGDGLNWYDYTGGDPVNGTDPTGTECQGTQAKNDCDGNNQPPPPPPPPADITVVGRFIDVGQAVAVAAFEAISSINPVAGAPQPADIIVTGRKEKKPTPAKRQPAPTPPAPTPTPPSVYGSYYRGRDGKLHFTPEGQKKVCANYNGLQDGAAKANDGYTVIGTAGGFFGGVPGSIIGGLSTGAALITSITTGSGFRPFGITIVPKGPPPPGC